MRSSRTLYMSAAVAACLALTINATPAPIRIGRREVTTIENCGKNEDKIKTDLKDAKKIVDRAVKIDKDSQAYKHYLRDDDYDAAKGLWEAIGKNEDEDDAVVKFGIKCGDDKDGCEKGSLAVTDASAGDNKQIVICPAYFTTDETKRTLDSKPFKKNPKRGVDSWCKPGQQFKDIEVGGHTLVHEMTHLDKIGDEAGLSERKDTHGTEDVGGLGSSYQPAARALKKLWDDKKNGDGTLTPVENAENSAAAALEWYYKEMCDIDLP